MSEIPRGHQGAEGPKGNGVARPGAGDRGRKEATQALSVELQRLYYSLAAVLFGLLLYGFTCAPGVLWQDSATFQFRVWHTELRSDLGLALAHPLYILLAKVFAWIPIGGNFAFRVNRPNFDEARSELKGRSIEFEFQDHDIAHSIYFHDPDGHEVEITTYEV